MVDVFGEVDEQLRSQRYTSLVRRGWPFAAAAVGAALIAALGVWGWTMHVQSEEAKASVAYHSALEAAAKSDFATADRGFSALALTAPAAYRALALMQQAQIRLEQKNPADAVRLLDQAAKAAPDAIMGDDARLKAAWILMDKAPLAEIEARLEPLTTAKAPYRPLAMEALAMARLQAGKLDEARGDFSVLSLSQDVSQSAQARAHAALELIQSGSAKMIPGAVTAALDLPPSAMPQPALSAAQAGAAQ